MRSPCKNCEDRRLGCHSGCEKYQAFWKQSLEIGKKRNQETRLNVYVAEAVQSTKSGRNGSWKAYRKVEEK